MRNSTSASIRRRSCQGPFPSRSCGPPVSELCALSQDTFLLSESGSKLLVKGKDRKERILQTATDDRILSIDSVHYLIKNFDLKNRDQERAGALSWFCIVIWPLYLAITVTKRSSMVATSAREAGSPGRRLPLSPVMMPEPTAQRMASSAQVLTWPASPIEA